MPEGNGRAHANDDHGMISTTHPHARPTPPLPSRPGMPHQDWAAPCLYAALFASAVLMLPLMLLNRLYLDMTSPAFGGLAAAAIVLAAVRLSPFEPRRRWHRRSRDFAEHALVMLTLGVLGAIASYAAAADTSGFYDAVLARSDGILHFDWVALYRLVAGHRLLQHLGAAAYGSIYLSPWALLGWLAWHGESGRAHRFLLTFWVASVLTIALFPLFPARGALEFLWHGPIAYMPTSGLYQGEIIPALRAHTIHAIDLGTVRGIVCAPSFHTACAVIFMTTAWPFPALRRVIVPVNLAMLLATPVEGTHYLTDMLLGAGVAILAIVTVRLLPHRAKARTNGENSPFPAGACR